MGQLNSRTANSRIVEQRNDLYLNKHEELGKALTAARMITPDETLYGEFKQRAKTFVESWDAKVDERIKANVKRMGILKPFSFAKADDVYQGLPELNKKAIDARAAATAKNTDVDKAWAAYQAADLKAAAAEKAFAAENVVMKGLGSIGTTIAARQGVTKFSVVMAVR